MYKDYDIKLASKSPRRRQLLAMLDVDFEIAPIVEVDEVVPDGIAPEDVSLYLARLKADAYRDTIGERDLYITADTIVISADGEILGKPADRADAARMLSLLSGRSHKVITGVCAFTRERLEQFKVETTVEFAELTAEEIDYYLNAYSPMDKAGAYGIQEWIGAIGIKGINGSFYNVMGLPVHRLYRCLLSF